jgi:Glyoxalase-like domain
MSLALDHVFCMVDDLDEAASRVEGAGWVLDAGSVHAGQGTRNRRLVWPQQYLELVCITDSIEARSNRLRLDRRGHWSSTGASPFGLGFRGELPDECRRDYWLYDELGPRIWVHRDNEQAHERPLVFVLELTAEERERRRSRSQGLLSQQPAGTLEEVRVRGPASARLPPYDGPRVAQCDGTPHLELRAGRGPARRITDILAISASG